MACNLAVVSGMAFEAKIARGQGIENIYGLAPIKLVQDMESAATKGVCGFLSFGTAAGLLPSLAPGSIVIARAVLGAHQEYAADERWSHELHRQLPGSVMASVAGVDRAIKSVEEKSLLHRDSGVATADMESHLMAHIAQKHHLPFAVLRVVLDDARCALPQAALAATTSYGTVNYAGLIGSLLAQPGQLPAMIRLARDNARAKQSLLRCGHLLKGSRFGLVHLGR